MQIDLYAVYKYDKNKQVLEWIGEKRFGISGIAETGLNWDKLRPSRSLPQHVRRIYGSVQLVVIQAFNRHDKDSITQWDRVVLVIRGKWVSYTSDFQVESTGLGRWVSALITGKNKYKTRIMVTYRPNVRGNSATVSSQHERYF